MSDERVANLAARSRHDVKDAWRNAGVERDPAQLDSASWSIRGGLENHTVAGGQRGCNFVTAQGDGRVPGRNGGHHAPGFVNRHAQVVAAWRSNLGAQRLNGGGTIAEGRSAVDHLILAFLPYLPVFEHLAARQQVRALQHEIRNPVEQLCAVVRQHVAPGRLGGGFVRGVYGRINVSFRAGADFIIDFAGGRIYMRDVGRGLAYPFSADEKRQRFNTRGRGHSVLLKLTVQRRVLYKAQRAQELQKPGILARKI